MAFELEKQELANLIETFKNDLPIYKDRRKNYNEQNTRQQYIDKFLKVLDWDITNPRGLDYNNREVVAEEYSNRQDRPDYTIRMNNSSIFYIEAKKVSVEIQNDVNSALQARRYGWNSGHNISVLTNFEYTAIYLTYKMPEETDTASSFRYKLYHYSEYIEKFDEIYDLLSRNSVLSGHFHQWTTNIIPSSETRLSLNDVFLKQLNVWRVKVAQDLVNSGNLEYLDKDNLNERVQSFLNQIIFLRFAEDNHLELGEVLKTLSTSSIDYNQFLHERDIKYNSGIFTENVLENIQSETLKEIILNLYFPNVSYDFSVIDLAILSKIYENFIQEELIIDENNSVILEKTKSAKIKAVVSTPEALVRLMVQDVLKDKLEGISPDQLLEMKIADLSVGSGIFLIESYNYIENYLVDWYAKTAGIAPTPFLVPFAIKRKVIEDVLYGVDLNPQAVQLTKFSLLLRILQNEDIDRVESVLPMLPSLESNIINGNSLISERDIEISKIKINNLVEIMPTSNDYFESLRFDIILGNPPYLTTSDMKKSTPVEELEAYKVKYRSSYRQYDKYFLFMERALELLKVNGEAILLVPNKFLLIQSGIKLRRLLKENKAVLSILDFGTAQLFDDVTNYVAVVKLTGATNDTFSYTAVDSIAEAFDTQNRAQLVMDDLADELWFLSTNPQLVEKYKYMVDNFPNILEEIYSVNGIQTSANSVYVLEKKFINVANSTPLYYEFNKKPKL